MSDDQLAKFKQYLDEKIDPISAQMGEFENQFKSLESRFDVRFDNLDQKLIARMDSGFAGIGDSITELNTRIDAYMSQTDRRLRLLESSH